MAGKARAAEDVDPIDLFPLGVLDGEEVPHPIDAEVIDEDVGFRLGLDEGLAAGHRGEVSDDAARPGTSFGWPESRQGGVDALPGASDHDHGGAGRSQALGDGQADAAGGAGDDGGLVCEVNDHASTPLVASTAKAKTCRPSADNRLF